MRFDKWPVGAGGQEFDARLLKLALE